jgi:hypothetical protein
VRSALAIVTVALAAGVAQADPPRPIWIGVVQPASPPTAPCECDVLTAIARPVSIVVLPSPNVTSATDGTKLHVLQPLLGMAVTGVIAGGKLALPAFIVDRRRNHDEVIVVGGDVTPTLVTPSAAELAAVKVVVGHAESLEGVRKATAKLELGLVDLDGDGKADVGATYGCKVWGDGACQVTGQFVVVRGAGGWKVLE